MKKIIIALMAFTSVSAFASGRSSADLSISGTTLAAQDCPQLSGRYYENMDLIDIYQVACTSLTWELQDAMDSYPPIRIDYILDGVEREAPKEETATKKVYHRAHYEADKFVVEDRIVYAESTDKIVHHYYISRTHCNFGDNGANYLVDETTFNGGPGGCAFWRN